MSSAGLNQRFVIFGTLAHQILLIMYEYGPQSAPSIYEALHDEQRPDAGPTPDSLKSVITKLRKLGFIHTVGRAGKEGQRTHFLYHYKKTKVPVVVIRVPGKDRQAKYRAVRATIVSSVFNFRGTIDLS